MLPPKLRKFAKKPIKVMNDGNFLLVDVRFDLC